MKRFDRKFGADLIRELPTSPAVYLFKDEAGEVVYAGKAKNVRRRLSDYRNASRRKAHRKMRAIVREAMSVEVRLQPSEAEALLVESALIQELRPRFNVDGAFDFLYPAIGTGRSEGRLVLCFSSKPAEFESLDLRWHGVFRPRSRARSAFDALAGLFGQLGHSEPRSRLPVSPRPRGSRLVAIRRLPDVFLEQTQRFLDGEDDTLLPLIAEHLLEREAARRVAPQIEEDLRLLEDFYKSDVTRLRTARNAIGRAASFVSSGERDMLFLKVRLDSALNPDD